MQTKLNLVKGITREELPDLAIESGEGIVALDQKGCVISVNSEAEKILGWGIDDIKDKDFFAYSNFSLQDVSQIVPQDRRSYKYDCLHSQPQYPFQKR